MTTEGQAIHSVLTGKAGIPRYVSREAWSFWIRYNSVLAIALDLLSMTNVKLEASTQEGVWSREMTDSLWCNPAYVTGNPPCMSIQTCRRSLSSVLTIHRELSTTKIIWLRIVIAKHVSHVSWSRSAEAIGVALVFAVSGINFSASPWTLNEYSTQVKWIRLN